MKKFILLLTLSMGLKTACADNFKILFVNDANLKYTNGKGVKQGDIIKDAKDIDWKKAKQAVKVINMKTKKQSLFTGKSFIREGGINALVNQKYLSTHDEGFATPDEGIQDTVAYKLSQIFSSEYALINSTTDSLEIETDLDISENGIFWGTYEYGDAKVGKQLICKNGKIIIDKSIFIIDDKKLEPRDIKLSIDYIEDNGRTRQVKDGIELTIIPEQLESD